MLVLSLTIAVILSGLSLVYVSAQNALVTGQQIEQIQVNCLSNKNTLNQLHASDALLRVNQGQIYESMTTKLMERFNSRVASSRLNNDNLVVAVDNYKTALGMFRLDYKKYEEHLSAAISINCIEQPVEFYNAVADARILRSQVHNDVVILDQYIDQYQLSLDQFEKDYQSIFGGVSK